ncbi:unnamed protein product [Rotaria sordida]|uniref:Uncharacterized protein n=1 Tax=Rotaria sordida TaxID=392033 RepID=A0A814ZXY4_9BILA|nr:unnamed protein product [Rotaria sordida]CAF1515089.1 unnamed protein product [Rotaria sordida]
MNNTIDNHQWKQIIRNYLQKLQVLRLTMRDKCTAYENMQKQILRDDHRECEEENDSEDISLFMNDDEFCDETTSYKDEFIQWLTDRLPSTGVIVKDSDSLSHI